MLTVMRSPAATARVAISSEERRSFCSKRSRMEWASLGASARVCTIALLVLWGVYRFKRGFGGSIRYAYPPMDRIYILLLYKLYLWRFSNSGAD